MTRPFRAGRFNSRLRPDGKPPTAPVIPPGPGQDLAWVEALAAIQERVTRLVQTLQPKAVVRWTDDEVGTDHTRREDDGTWVIALNPARLFLADSGRKTYSRGRIRATGIAGLFGAACHEVAHTRYSPERADLTAHERAVYRIYEDAYINARLVCDLLPGARSFVQHAMLWSNPPRALAAALTEAAERPSFDSYADACAAADLVCRGTFDRAQVRVPAELVPMLNAVAPMSSRLISDDEISWDERLALYRQIVNEIARRLPPEADRQNAPQNAGRGDGPHGTGTPGGPDGAPGAAAGRDSHGCRLGEPTGRALPRRLRAAAIAANRRTADGRQGAPGSDSHTVGSAGTPPRHADARLAIDVGRVERLRLLFRTRTYERHQPVHGSTAGRLSGRRLWQLAGGASERVFREHQVRRESGGAVLLLIDGSQSMVQHNNAGVAARAATEVHLALAGFPGYSVYTWLYDSDAGELRIREAEFDGRSLRFLALSPGGTPSHAAMVEAGSFLRARHPALPRLIIHFSDLLFADEPTAEFERLGVEPRLAWATVTCDADEQLLHAQQSRFPAMHISSHTAHRLVGAIEQIVAAHVT
jgi:hypothetical protein